MESHEREPFSKWLTIDGRRKGQDWKQTGAGEKNIDS